MSNQRIQQAKERLTKLEEQEEIYLEQDSEQHLIRLYENMHRQLKILLRAEPEEYSDYAWYIRKKLVNAYIKYGTYLKSERKDLNTAKGSLEKALTLNAELPIVHYRLGFLAYERQDYAKALHYFNEAVQVQGEQLYGLSVQQRYYAQLYLANSALYMAHAANEALVHLPQGRKLTSYELSPIFEQLSEREQFLRGNSFYCFSEVGVEMCSHRQCDWLRDTPQTLILHFSDRENVCAYNGIEELLSVNLANTLRHLLLVCSEQQPGTRSQFTGFFDADEVRADAFRQRMSRLRGKLAKIGLTDVIGQTRLAGETAYYVKQQPFLVLYRVDEDFAYDYANKL
ncbi:MAG: tetratricopeptide repeat protein [Solibacillus sp.]